MTREGKRRKRDNAYVRRRLGLYMVDSMWDQYWKSHEAGPMVLVPSVATEILFLEQPQPHLSIARLF